jgi:transcriptional regulator with XRE-family HTH domain
VKIDQDTLYRYIGAAIRRRRETLGLTQAQLASEAGVLRTSIVNLEAGRQRVPLHTLYPICAALSVELAEVVPRLQDVVVEEQLVLPIDGIDQVVPPRTAALLNELIGERPARGDV